MSLDFNAAADGMGRDLHEVWTSNIYGRGFLVLLFALPLASLLMLVKRRWLALVPLAGWLTSIVTWFLYYATEWIGPVDGAMLSVVFFLVLVGWLALGAATLWPDRVRKMR